MSTPNLPTFVPTTTLLIPNMHCPSCVETITNLLDIPQIKNLNISLLLHSVTFNIDDSLGTSKVQGHTTEKAVANVVAILTREGGFIVEQTSPTGPTLPLTSSSSAKSIGVLDRLTHIFSSKKAIQRRKEEERRKIHLDNCQACKEGRTHDDEELPSPTTNDEKSPRSSRSSSPAQATSPGITRTTLSIDGMTCASCVQSIDTVVSAHPGVLAVDINLLASSGTVRHRSEMTAEEIKELVDDTGFEVEIISSIPENPPKKRTSNNGGLIKTAIMVEGMTCASCSSAIQKALKGTRGVEEISIDVLGNKGVIIHTDAISPTDITAAIEDIGYGAEVTSSAQLSPEDTQEQDQPRQVTVRVEGIYCGLCIKKLNAHLTSLSNNNNNDNNNITSTPFTIHNHTTTVSYLPRKPFTIRDILAGLSGVSPEFEASVVKDRSMNDRSREIQKREVRILLIHWVIAFVFTIPTFVIAIIGMALLPSSHHFRMYWMKAIWGAANLGTVVLWPLATVVQFGVGRLFYIRAFASMKPHVRRLIPGFIRPRPKGNPRPLTWRSFFNFGSMDLLVVLSTSVSYFASLAMLILDVRADPASMSVGTYFDSCVFLIMFILLGRVLEAYAKSRTTDAVSLLGQLRPEMALLIESSEPNGEADAKAEGEKDDQHTDSTSESGASDGHHTFTSTTRQVPVEVLERDDLILIPPGSLPPTDGVIIHGSTTVDESSLTGESKPVKKSLGDEMFTGTTNLQSAITIRITKVGGETMLEKIIGAVSDASGRKAPIEKLAEKLTGYFVPIIVYLSLVVLAIWLSLGLTGRVTQNDDRAGGTVFFAIEFAIATLVVACPCGIGLAVPCANAVGTGLVAKNGILASGGGEAFLGATKVDTVVLDKTGTLTLGKSTVTDVRRWEEGGSSSGADEYNAQGGGGMTVERMVREIEKGSTHPLAQGIVAHLDSHLPSPTLPSSNEGVDILETQEIAGRGIKAVVQTGKDKYEILIGNTLFLTDNDTHLTSDQAETVEQWTSDAKSVVLVATRLIASPLTESTTQPFALTVAYALSDPPRPTTLAALNRLRELGMRIIMLSGDNPSTAHAVGKMVGIKDESEIFAGVSPEGKAQVIRELQSQVSTRKVGRFGRALGIFRGFLGLKTSDQVEGQMRKVMFVGDGLNDSVALAAADISVAMGHGSQATLAGSDFVLLSSNLESLPILIHLSGKITQRQKLNLAWAIIFNIVCLPFAAGVFYPAGGIRLTPVWSAVVMACSSLSVVCSSLALRWGL